MERFSLSVINDSIFYFIGGNMQHLPESLKDTVEHGNVRYPFRIHESLEYAKNHLLLYLHWHTQAELFYLLEGNVNFRIGERNYTVHAGEVVMIPPHTLHSASVLDSETCHFIALVFDTSVLGLDDNSALNGTYIAPFNRGTLRFRKHIIPNEAWEKAIISDMKDLIPFAEKPQESCEIYVRGKLLTIWHHLYEHAEVRDAVNPDYERIRPAILYIQKNYAKPMSISDIAEQTGLSVSRFSFLFQKEMNMSSITYLLQYRIQQSCILLQTTGMTVANIALETGFGNLSNFNRSFLKHMSCTPSAFRQESIKLREKKNLEKKNPLA